MFPLCFLNIPQYLPVVRIHVWCKHISISWLYRQFIWTAVKVELWIINNIPEFWQMKYFFHALHSLLVWQITINEIIIILTDRGVNLCKRSAMATYTVFKKIPHNPLYVVVTTSFMVTVLFKNMAAAIHGVICYYKWIYPVVHCCSLIFRIFIPTFFKAPADMVGE